MKLNDLASRLDLQLLTPALAARAEAQVARGWVSDLLSDVLANAPPGAVLVTIQAHLNVVAVALHAELAAVIFAGGRVPDEPVVRKAADEGLLLYGSEASAFDLAGALYGLGLRGARP